MNNIPTAHFGAAAKKAVDWRKEVDEDPDDTELAETPPDIVKMLGFDPAKENKSKTVDDALARIDATVSRSDAEWKESDHPRAKDGKFGSGGGKAKASPKSGTKAKKPISLSQAIKDKPSQAEKSWHEKTSAWETAPPLLTDAIANTKGLMNVSIDPGTVSFYRPWNHSVHMGYNLFSPDNKTVLVWRHEYGHAMDYNGEETPQSAKCENAMEYDASTPEKLLNISWEYNNAFFSGLEDNKGDGEDGESYRREDGLFLADFVAALTSNRYGYGHSSEYFSNPKNRLAEMFANYVTLVGGRESEKYYKLLHSIAPSTCRSFDLILEDMSGKKRSYKRGPTWA